MKKLHQLAERVTTGRSMHTHTEPANRIQADVMDVQSLDYGRFYQTFYHRPTNNNIITGSQPSTAPKNHRVLKNRSPLLLPDVI